MGNSNKNKVKEIAESKTEMVDLNENQCADVSGGYIFDAGRSDNNVIPAWNLYEPVSIAGVPSKPFEVIDDGNGEVLGRYATKKEAKKMAKRIAQSTKEIDWDEVKDLRNT